MVFFSQKISFQVLFSALFTGLATICVPSLAEELDLSPYQNQVCREALLPVRALKPLGKKLSKTKRIWLFEQALHNGTLKLYRQKGIFQVYKIRGKDLDPELLHHLGVLREETFRAVDEGSGLDADVDAFDKRYDHLLVWSATDHDIVGAYRLGEFKKALQTGRLDLMYTQSLFHFSPDFFRHFTGEIAEMGRSFVVQKYQNQSDILALLWGGIAEYLYQHKKMRYLCGPVSLSGSYSPLSKALIRDYFMKHHGDPDNLRNLMKPEHPFTDAVSLPAALKEQILSKRISDFNTMIESLEGPGKGIPPLIKHYPGLLNARFIEAIVDPTFNTVDFLICVDVTGMNARKAEYFMGDKQKVQSLIERKFTPQPD
jgi:putative hemolysin